MYALNMLRIATELSQKNPSYQDIASKFFEHFLFIAKALSNIGKDHTGLWDEEDQFFYDLLHLPNGESMHMKVRSMVGLIPLYAIETIDPRSLETFPILNAVWNGYWPTSRNLPILFPAGMTVVKEKPECCRCCVAIG